MNKLVEVNSIGLKIYDDMCRAVDACYTVDEVLDIRDEARKWEAYAKIAMNTEAERKACEIRLRAERKAGQFRMKMDKPAGARGVGKKVDRTDGSPLSNAELGISDHQSADWQKLAEASDDEFETALKASDKPTTKGILRAIAEPKTIAVSKEALWLAGRLRDFKEDGILGMAPSNVMSTMTDQMKDLVHTLAPQVAGWLKRIGEIK